MGAYRLLNSQFTTLPRQTSKKHYVTCAHQLMFDCFFHTAEKLSPHRLRRTHTMERPSGITAELAQILARRRRWEESEEKQ